MVSFETCLFTQPWFYFLNMGEKEIEIAIKAFEENRVNTDHNDPYRYNLAVGLLAMARAIEETQDQIIALKIQVGNVKTAVNDLDKS